MKTNLSKLFLVSLAITAALGANASVFADDRPNILFCIADDWGWPNAGAYGDPVVKTPSFDRIAREGILFENAFVAAPTCTACRNSLLTGQWFWRLDEGANLWSTLHPSHPVYPLLLEKAGYHVGHWRKIWGPGDWKALGRTAHPAGEAYKNLAAFFKARPEGKPFCLGLGASDPHRPYTWQSGAKSGIDIQRLKVPADLPDSEIVRHDVADYLFEVQRFDRDVGTALRLLEEMGELENTLVVMTGDHGMPFPRHKSNLYDSGTHVPLAMRWPGKIEGGRKVTDFVSFTDLAPTFLEMAGVGIPAVMTGRSLMKVLTSPESGRVDPGRGFVLSGKERHGMAQEKPNSGGYPMRAIRTDDFLYIRNFFPDRWPGGCPDGELTIFGNAYGDCDGGPTKTFILENRDDPAIRPFYDLTFAKRPAEELYDLRKDPDQIHNIASNPEYDTARKKLAEKLTSVLTTTEDPRVVGGGETFDTYPWRRPERRKK